LLTATQPRLSTGNLDFLNHILITLQARGSVSDYLGDANLSSRRISIQLAGIRRFLTFVNLEVFC
jgi:hypothetical protein